MRPVKFPGIDANGKRDVASIPFTAIKQVIVDGAAADTNIAIAGIKTTDDIISAVNLTDAAMAENPAVTSAGNIQFPTENTTGKKVLVTYVANG